MATLVPPVNMSEPLTRAYKANAESPTESAAQAPADAATAGVRQRFVATLFTRYREPLFRYVSGMLRSRQDAEDVVQETYARVLDAAGLEPVESRARAYLFRVATNLAHDRFRARRLTTTADVDPPAHAEAEPEIVVDFVQGLWVIERALLDLKPRCREVFLLPASEQLEYEEIALRLGVSKRTVEREMRHALDVCQRRLKRSR